MIHEFFLMFIAPRSTFLFVCGKTDKFELPMSSFLAPHNSESYGFSSFALLDLSSVRVHDRFPTCRMCWQSW